MTAFKKNLLIVILSLLSIVSINYYYFGANAMLFKNSVVNIFLFAAAFIVIKKAILINDKLINRVSSTISLMLSGALVAGHSILKDNTLGEIFGSIEIFAGKIVILAGFYIFFQSIFKLIFSYFAQKDIVSPLKNQYFLFGNNTKSFIFIWFLIFMCWIPCYLAYYPGIYSYDIMVQTYQVLSREITRFHSTAHTFIFMLCMQLGISTGGGPASALVIYSILQMLFMSFVFSAVLWYMAKINMHYGLRIITFIWFALNPVNAIFSFVPTKDVMFAGIFVLLTISVIDLIRNPEGFFKNIRKQLIFGILIVMFCLFRGNAIYAAILFLPIFIYAFRKKYLKKMAVVSACAILCYALINGPVFTLLGVKPGNVKEALSVPMQQIAAVAVRHKDEMTETDIQKIDEFLDYSNIELYNPRYADPIKDRFKVENFVENSPGFLSLWFEYLVKYPVTYIESFMSLNLGYWYPDNTNPDEFSRRVYIETNINKYKPFLIGERDSKLPALYNFYQIFADGVEPQKIPVASALFGIGYPVWFLIFAAGMLIVKRKRKMVLILLPAFFMWLTFMAGPVSNLRYIYATMACYPVYLSVIVQSDKISP